MISTYNENGDFSSISFGYHMNDIIRRTLKFNDEGNLIKDYIFMFNPLFSDREVKYSALVLPNIPIFDYLIEDKRLFKNDRGAFINDILPDLLIEDYINYNDYYGTILDAFSNLTLTVKMSKSLLYNDMLIFFLLYIEM